MNAKPAESVEIERSLLGGLIEAPDALDEIASAVVSSDFYRPDHGRLFDVLREMRSEAAAIRPETVGERVLHDRRGDDAFGGYGYVLQLIEKAATRTSLGYYARRVRALSLHRAALRVVGRLHDQLRENEADPTQAAAMLASAAEALSLDLVEPGGSIERAVAAVLTQIAEAGAGVRRPGVPMPFRSLADLLPRMTAGQLGIVAARPSIGKTSFALQIGMTVAAFGHPVAIVSLEMTRDELVTRELAAATGIPTQDLDAGIAADDDDAWARLDEAQRAIGVLPVDINDASSLTVEEIVGYLRTWRAKAASKADVMPLAVVDYLGLVAPSPGQEKALPVHRLGHVTWSLKACAKSLGMPIVLLSQLNRDLEKRDDKRPMLSDLRDSGSIEQDANWVIGLFREGWYDRSIDDVTAEAIVLKNRGGRVGTAPLGWDGPRTRFFDQDEAFDLEVFDA